MTVELGQAINYGGHVFAQCGWLTDDGSLYPLGDPPDEGTTWPVYRSMGRVYQDVEYRRDATTGQST